MLLQFLDRHFARTVFVVAGLLLLAALGEAFLQLFGLSAIGRAYSPGRLMELSATLLLFVIVQLLRQVRDALVRG